MARGAIYTPSLSAAITCWPSSWASGQAKTTRRKPAASRARSQLWAESPGEPGSRSGASEKRHQPSSSPKVSVAKGCTRPISFRISRPPRFSSAFAWSSVRAMLAVACSTFEATTTS